jgi:hypothetical protein
MILNIFKISLPLTAIIYIVAENLKRFNLSVNPPIRKIIISKTNTTSRTVKVVSNISEPSQTPIAKKISTASCLLWTTCCQRADSTSISRNVTLDKLIVKSSSH